jgi:hypothetical protein
MEADHIVLALGVRPNRDVVEAFGREFGSGNVFAVGNASRGGRIVEAIRDGFEAASVFEP